MRKALSFLITAVTAVFVFSGCVDEQNMNSIRIEKFLYTSCECANDILTCETVQPDNPHISAQNYCWDFPAMSLNFSIKIKNAMDPAEQSKDATYTSGETNDWKLVKYIITYDVPGNLNYNLAVWNQTREFPGSILLAPGDEAAVSFAAFSTDMINNLIDNSTAFSTSADADLFFNTPVIVNVVAEGVDNVGRTIKSNELSLPFYPTPKGTACVVCTYDEEEETASN